MLIDHPLLSLLRDSLLPNDSVVNEFMPICESLEDGDDDCDEEIVDVVC